MTLPSSGAISTDMIRAEYGGSSPFRIQDYYRGGPRVPNTAANSGVPTSGAISLRNFLGQGGAVSTPLTAYNSNAYGSQYRNEPAPASLSVSASGTVVASGGSGAYTCTWVHLSGDPAVPTPGANNFNPSFSAIVSKGGVVVATKRCTVGDGLTSVITDMSVTLEYSTNL